MRATQLNQTTTVTNGNVTTTSTGSQLGSTLQDAAIQSLLNATGGFGGVATQLGKNGILGAIINAVKSDTDSQYPVDAVGDRDGQPERRRSWSDRKFRSRPARR